MKRFLILVICLILFAFVTIAQNSQNTPYSSNVIVIKFKEGIKNAFKSDYAFQKTLDEIQAQEVSQMFPFANPKNRTHTSQ